MKTKACSVCKVVKEATTEHFCKHCQTKDGLHPQCKLCHNSKTRKWQKDNPEKVKATHEAWTKANPDKVEASNLRYRQTHRDLLSERTKAWKKLNPEKVAANKRAYRARKYNAEGSYTAEEWRLLVDKYDGRCLCCNVEGDAETLSPDHVVPLAQGGTDYITNIQPLCIPCNVQKNNRYNDFRIEYEHLW